MKIIATQDDKTFFVQATADELARVMGFDSDWHRRQKKDEKLCVGSNIRIDQMWTRIQKLDNHNRAVKDALKSLTHLHDAFREAEPIIDKAIAETKA